MRVVQHRDARRLELQLLQAFAHAFGGRVHERAMRRHAHRQLLGELGACAFGLIHGARYSRGCAGNDDLPGELKFTGDSTSP